MKTLALLAALGGCAAPACRPVSVATAPPQVIEHTVMVEAPSAPPGVALVRVYDDALPTERAIVRSAAASKIWTLTKLDLSARQALRPIQRHGHHATEAEVRRAVIALGELRAFLQSQGTSK